MKIGLVLAESPGYSETFFRSKIQGLIKEGFQVKLFVGNKSKSKNGLNVYKAWPVNKQIPILQLILTFFVLLQLFFRAPGPVIRFYKLEKNDGNPFRKILERIYLNAHILPQKLDWVHFGFATLTVGKENTAGAIKAKMAVSFRGFDICIFPLKHPGIYDDLWKKLNKIHTISDDLYNIALKLGLPGQIPYVKITPAINIERFTVQNRNFKLSNSVKILTVARLHWKKGLEYALAALKILHERGIEFEYNIVGEGPDMERLIFERHEFALDNQVHFLGKQKPDHVVGLMNASQIYLQPSIQEGFCNAVLEAQSCGLLCIVSDAEGLAENVLDGKSGWVLPKRDFRAIADKIVEITHMDEIGRKKISDFAMQRVKDAFNVEDQNKKFKAFYEN